MPFLFAPTPHTEAAAFIANKPALPRSVFDKLLPELKARAFTIAGVKNFDTLQAIRDRIADLPLGANWEDIKKDIVPQLLPDFIDPEADAETQKAQTEAAERRAELLIRTHGQQAYATASYKIADAQRDIFPMWMYQTLQDGAVRPSHAALDGIVLPCDDPFWATHTPPWDWGCRCQFIPITEADAEIMREQDKEKPYEQQRVLDDDARNLLNSANTIYRGANLGAGGVNGGHPLPYNVAAPSQTAKANPYTWHPSEQTLTLPDLRARYDSATWDAFEQWAKATEIPGQGRTILEWLRGNGASGSQSDFTKD
jgi:SPP1 gp7 family putative phage head morphogenesis protein